jgi:hypothetical protein
MAMSTSAVSLSVAPFLGSHPHQLHAVLNAPGNGDDTNNNAKYTCQIVVSWPVREGFFDSPSPVAVPETDEGSISLIKRFASTWAEPFRSLILSIPSQTETKRLSLSDWPPPRGLRTFGSVALVGDALHPMAMCEHISPSLLTKQSQLYTKTYSKTDRGEGANHAIVDVLDLVELVVPHLAGDRDGDGDGDIRSALDRYEDRVVARARPAVLASRQACLDAHDWRRINAQSPLLTKRAMNVEFDEGTTGDVEPL